MARGAAVDVPPARWFSRLGQPLAGERQLADAYAGTLGLPSVVVARDWQEADRVTRDAASAAGWWQREEDERRRLMRETAARLGETGLLELLTAGVEKQVEATFEQARRAGGDEALARAASGAALMALHNHCLAMAAGCGADHPFVQKYALFAAGRWPLGARESALIVF